MELLSWKRDTVDVYIYLSRISGTEGSSYGDELRSAYDFQFVEDTVWLCMYVAGTSQTDTTCCRVE
jgi:hypothetical protein